LVENIIKSNGMSTTAAAAAAIGKLFGDDGAYEGNEIFRYLENNGIMPCIKVRKRMLEGYGKKGTSLEIYQFWHKEMIYKIGKRIAL
jgi:hypothetical protein